MKNNKLGGIQLLTDSDFSSDFLQKFAINTIPRFILIDREGRVLENDAKRPSDAALITQLDALLK